jgi:hypothetical protein
MSKIGGSKRVYLIRGKARKFRRMGKTDSMKVQSILIFVTATDKCLLRVPNKNVKY